jgi:hypothetical protein
MWLLQKKRGERVRGPGALLRRQARKTLHKAWSTGGFGTEEEGEL